MLPLRRVGPVVKLGEGELGGKARLLPFLDRLLEASKIAAEFAPHTISVPETWVLATDSFSEFVGRNHLESCADVTDDGEVRRRFLAGRLPPAVCASLKLYLESHLLPLAVRSSALSEDTHYHTTAGLFTTLFIPNRGPNRLNQLMDAVKLVYASAFYADVSRYMRDHSIPREDERMAIALETVVGTARGQVYYPLVSGVAQSVNYFPVGQMKPEDGVVSIVMGLGRRAVQGLDGLRFCPAYPLVRPSMVSEVDFRRTTQQLFDAVNLEAGELALSGSDTETLITLPVEAAAPHGVLAHVASVWDPDARIFYESLMQRGERVLTFSRLLRETSLPFPTMLRRVLQVIEDGFGLPVEIEFALDVESGGGELKGALYLLQARPLPSAQRGDASVEVPEVRPDELLLSTNQALGNGAVDGVRSVVFVDPADFSLQTSSEIADEVARLNERQREANDPYLLLGPGRWGSCNKAVGVPVKFRQIDMARLIAEVSTPELSLEPSQGTHFFHNVVSKSLFYLTVDTRVGHACNLEWLRAQPNAADTRLVKLIHAPDGLSIRVDGTKRAAVVYRAGGLGGG
ncbi:MAG: hypothetical protein IT371_05015 [Deltaproteobacteria bacterium]|nr:hypothetical protein [Deltaproteobacteria bacterium]